MGAGIEVGLANASCAFGSMGKLLMVLWRDSPKEKGRWTREQLIKHVHRHRHGVFFLIVLEKTVSVPSAETRRAIAETIDELGDAVSAIAVVFEGQGFFAATIKSAATSIIMLIGSRVPFRGCSSLEDALEFFGNRGGSELPDVVRLKEGVGTLRGAIGRTATESGTTGA